ncbi:DUF2062 domain-containing protein [Candidatus Electronema sp. TJ]|uniref:DUF2062 domain-containing protein n=1 Tax=Candidatus Electronema sp. TJ TaxID=3401573 RepID=UPI003AA81129
MPVFLQKLARLPRYYFLRVKRLKGDPEYLARGFALGVFMGNLPFVPQTLLLIPVTIALKASTVGGIISSVIVNNPFTVTIQYYLAWRLGIFLLPGKGSADELHMLMQTVAEKGLISGLSEIGRVGLDTLLVLQVGGAAMGVVLAAASYYPVLKFFRTLRERKQRKHLLNREP